MQKIASFIYRKVLGFTLKGDFPRTIKQYIIIVAPHTSWHDFYMGLLLRTMQKLQINFVAKQSLFDGPFGWYFRSAGGFPVDRTGGLNKVEAIAQLFKEQETLRLTLAPEGTRKKVRAFRTGFYYIAKKANVPIVMITFDFGKKQNLISEPFYPTDNIEKRF